MNLDSILQKRLFRFECPDSLRLGEYHQNLLSGRERQRIRQHVQQCPHCQQELQQLEHFLAETPLPTPPGILERTLQEVEVLIGRLLPPRPGFQVRGDPENLRYYEVPGYGQITLDVQELSGGERSLVGLLLNIPPKGFHAYLWRGDDLAYSVSVDSLGNFIFENVSPGHYRLLLKDKTREIRLEDITV